MTEVGQDLDVVDLVETIEVDHALVETIEVDHALVEMTDHERCTKQLVGIVAMNVKYHLSQETINLFTVTIVFRIINQKEVTEVDQDLDVVDLVETIGVDHAFVETIGVDHALVETIDHERCTKQLVEIVAMNVKYHSNQKMVDQFIVQTVSKTIKKISKDYKNNNIII